MTEKEMIFKAIVNEPKKEHKILFLNKLTPAELKEFCVLHQETAKEIFDFDANVESLQELPVILRNEKFNQLSPMQRVGFQFICALSFDEIAYYQSELTRIKNNKVADNKITPMVRPLSELLNNSVQNVLMTYPHDKQGPKLIGGRIVEVE